MHLCYLTTGHWHQSPIHQWPQYLVHRSYQIVEVHCHLVSILPHVANDWHGNTSQCSVLFFTRLFLLIMVPVNHLIRSLWLRTSTFSPSKKVTSVFFLSCAIFWHWHLQWCSIVGSIVGARLGKINVRHALSLWVPFCCCRGSCTINQQEFQWSLFQWQGFTHFSLCLLYHLHRSLSCSVGCWMIRRCSRMFNPLISAIFCKI